MVRKALFWTHLVGGLLTGIVIFIMSFTGAAIALQPQILLWAEQEIRTVKAPADARWIGPEALLAKVREQRPRLTPTGITLDHDPTLAATVTLTESTPAGAPGGTPVPGGLRGQPEQTTLYVNPYTGDVLGQLDASTPARRFFRINTDWHRWLAMSGDQRTIGRRITGVSNAVFLLLAITGLYIWIPRVLSWPAVKAVTLFRRHLPRKARDFNWHNVIGVWSAAVLVVLTFTGMCISFPLTYDAIYAVTGIERPLAPPAPGGAPGLGSGVGRRDGDPAPREQSASQSPQGLSLAGLDASWARAEQHRPSWRSIALRLSPRTDQPVTFTFNDRDRVNPMARSTLAIDVASAQVVRWEPYEGLPTGQRLRTWMRFGHTGELWGLTGQIVAGLASAGSCALVYTGAALAWRRFTSWRSRRVRRQLGGSARAREAA